MTAKVRKRIRSRSGNGWPFAVANGSASAAASETMPRTPVNASANAHCHGGDGSLRLIAGKNQRGRYVAGYIQAKRAMIPTALTTAAETASSDIEYSPMREINVRAVRP